MVAPMKAIHAMNMQTYAHGLIMSRNVSASFNAGILPRITAMVLLTQCISIVSFSDPVL